MSVLSVSIQFAPKYIITQALILGGVSVSQPITNPPALVMFAIKGDTGPIGSGASAYQHTQSSAVSTWVINHNKGYNPLTKAYTVGGLEYCCEILNVSNNVVNILFDSPQSGYAVLI